MKRAAELIPLSHDHHQALRTAQLLRRASADNLAATLAHLRDFWADQGEPHFALEERVLTAELVADERWAAAVGRMRAEHEQIRAMVAGADTPEAVRALGDALQAHVRFEERELFPLVESALAPAELERVGAELAH